MSRLRKSNFVNVVNHIQGTVFEEIINVQFYKEYIQAVSTNLKDLLQPYTFSAQI